MARRLLTVLLLAGLAFTCLDTNAQTPHQSAPSLGLEVIFYSKQGPAYLAVRPSRSGAWFARFERVADWKQPADTLPVNAVNIACEAAESGVLSPSLGFSLFRDETRAGKAGNIVHPS